MYFDYVMSLSNPLDLNPQDDILDFSENNEEINNNLIFSNEQFSNYSKILDIDEQVNQNPFLELISAKEKPIEQNTTNFKVNIPIFYTTPEIVKILSLTENKNLKDKLNLVFNDNENNEDPKKEYNIENTNEYYKMMGEKRKREKYIFDYLYFDDEKLNEEKEKRIKK